MNIKVRLEQDEDNIWIATVPSLPGCISQGKTKEDSIKNIKEAIELHLESLFEENIPIKQKPVIEETVTVCI